MRTIANLLRAVRVQDQRNEALQAMADTRDNYLQYQKHQLFTGFDSKEQRLLPYASKTYAEKKAAMNPLPGFGNPDFYLTGEFYRSFRADIDNEGFRLYATDPDQDKVSFLERRDPNIWTLAPNAMKDYITDLKPVFVQRIIKTLNNAAV